jgi:UDP-glucose 4-epimerase
MRVLITGGSGFIGKNLIEYLSKKYEVFAPKHNELELLDENSVRTYLEKNKFDIVIHTAVRGGSRKSPTAPDIVKNNLKMFFNLVSNSNLYKKMIFIGSGADFDKSEDINNVREEDFGKRVPKDDYGFYKYVCSKFIEKADNITNLRVFGIFGKYEDYDVRLISNIICRIIFNLPVEINQNAVFDFVYVNDLCKIVEYFIENCAKEKFYNIGGEMHLELFSIVEKIKKISGKDFDIKIKKQGMNKEYTCNNSRLISELDFKFSNIDSSIEELYKWYLDNKNNIKKESLLLY